MSSFTTPLRVEAFSDTRWKLVEEFEYLIGDLDSGKVITVPVGFVTDFASIPRILWSILPPWGRYGKATVVHDYLYSKDGVYMDGTQAMKVTHKQADAIFLEAMTVLNVGKFVRTAMYLALRIYNTITCQK